MASPLRPASWVLPGTFRSGSIFSLHRCLTDGGAFMYPPDADFPTGKLRTLYEAAPLAFIAEQAHGAASTGTTRLLDVVPTSLHHTTPIVIGSADLVTRYQHHLAQ